MIHHADDVVQLLLVSFHILLVNLSGRLDHRLDLFPFPLTLSLFQSMKKLLFTLSGLHPHGLVLLLDGLEHWHLLSMDTTFVSSGFRLVMQEG